MNTPEKRYAFCETLVAGGTWHIRELTAGGEKFGGGADSLALCGREVCWDLQSPIVSRLLELSNCCKKCTGLFVAPE
jgi:hypothetical protein